MEKWQMLPIEKRLTWLKELHDNWERNLGYGSTDPSSAVTCTAKMLEAEAERKGIMFVLNQLGYTAEWNDTGSPITTGYKLKKFA